MDDHEKGRDMNRIEPHPGYRLIVIRGRDAEHNDSKRRGAGKRKRPPLSIPWACAELRDCLPGQAGIFSLAKRLKRSN